MLDFLYGLSNIAIEVLFQKLWLRDVPPIDAIGDSAEGMTCIVTGPTSGIGRETALALAKRGAHVVLACRSVARGERVCTEIARLARAHGMADPCLEVRELDLASLASVRRFAAKWEADAMSLHVLINNAGIFSMGAARCVTEDGFEAHMGTNFLGPALLTLLLLPALRRGAQQAPAGTPVRVVSLASKMHELALKTLDPADMHLAEPRAYASVSAYSQSKLAQIVWTAELRHRLGVRSGITAFAVHPGEVLTDVVRTLPGPMQAAYRVIMHFLCLTPAQGARSSIYCATSHDAILSRPQPEACYFGSGCEPISLPPCVVDPRRREWLWGWTMQAVQLPSEFDLPGTEGKKAA